MPESVCVPFPLHGLLELCQLEYLQYSLLDPSKTCPVPVCIPLCLSLASWLGGGAVCFDLFHFLPGLDCHWLEVLGGSQPDSLPQVLHSVQLLADLSVTF